MLLASRSWLYVPILRRAYTTSTSAAKPPLVLTQIYDKRYRPPEISTLRAENLVHSDFLVFAGRRRPTFHTDLSLRSPGPVHARRGATAVAYELYLDDRPHQAELEHNGTTMTAGDEQEGEPSLKNTPFPEHALGFLYLHEPPPESGLPRSASSIRFRCTPSLVEDSFSYVASLKPVRKMSPGSKPAVFLPGWLANPKIYKCFKAGYDLTLPSGVPWCIPITHAAGRPPLNNIRVQLLVDGLFSRSELHDYEATYKRANPNRGSNILHTLNDAFFIRFGSTNIRVWTTVGKGTAEDGSERKISQAIPEWKRPRVGHLAVLENVLTDKRGLYDIKYPYSGAAHARFELVPDSDYDKPMLCMRIVEMIEPVKCRIKNYDGYIHPPREGKLITYGPPEKPKPWICFLAPRYVPKEFSSLLLLIDFMKRSPFVISRFSFTNRPRAYAH